MEFPFGIQSIGDFGNIYQQLMNTLGYDIPSVGGTPSSGEEKTRWAQQNQGAALQRMQTAASILMPLLQSYLQKQQMEDQYNYQTRWLDHIVQMFSGGGSITDTAGGAVERRFNPFAQSSGPRFLSDPNFGGFTQNWGQMPLSHQLDIQKNYWNDLAHQQYWWQTRDLPNPTPKKA